MRKELIFDVYYVYHINIRLMPEKPKSRIEEITKKLYSTSFKDRPVFETLKEREYEVSDTWTPPEGSGSQGSTQMEPRHNRILKKILILSFSFFRSEEHTSELQSHV